MNIAVIGIGNMGKNHARVYFENKAVNLVAVCDINEQIGKQLSKKYNCNYYKDYKKLYESETIDAVSIVVPNSLHKEIAIYFLDKNVNVLLEKPISNNLADARKIINKSLKSNVIFMVGHIERYNPVVIKTNKLLKSGAIGEISSIITRRVGGLPIDNTQSDAAVDLAVHDIDIVNFLFNKLPDSVFMNKYSHKYKKTSDSVEIFMNYSNASAYIQANWITPVKIRKIYITGTKGYIESDYINQEIDVYQSNPEYFENSTKHYIAYLKKFSNPKIKKIKIFKKEPLDEEISYFINSIKLNKKISQNYALDALKIALNKY